MTNIKPNNYADLAMIGVVIESCDNGYTAHHPDLKGVLGYGATVNTCIDDYKAAVEQWFEVHMSQGRDIPDLSPIPEARFG